MDLVLVAMREGREFDWERVDVMVPDTAVAPRVLAAKVFRWMIASGGDFSPGSRWTTSG